MKKTLFFMLLAGASALTGAAQTDFRHISFDEALKAAKQEQKMLFVDFYTDWCGPCKKMAAEVFPQKNVGDYMNKNFVSLKLNAENEGAELAKKYGVAAYPTFVIIGADGKEIAKVTGYRPGDEFIAKMKTSVDPELSPENIKKRYESGDRTPKVVNSYVMSLMEKRKEKEGFEVVDSYFKSLSDADRLLPDNEFLFTRYTVSLDNDRAAFMIANRDKFVEESRPNINKRIHDLYHSELAKYFSGYVYSQGKFDEVEYGKLKSGVKEMGLDKNYNYDAMFGFIEKRTNCTDADYLEYCSECFSNLEPNDKTLLIMNLNRLFDTKDSQVRKGLSKFIRERLSTMLPIEIQVSGRFLGSLESNKN